MLQVRDLIYLLQTRCQPDDLVVFHGFVKGTEDLITEISGYSEGTFLDVWSYEMGPDKLCAINIGELADRIASHARGENKIKSHKKITKKPK